MDQNTPQLEKDLLLNPREFFFALNHYYQKRNISAVNKMAQVAKKRLENKGLRWCEGIGWCREKDIPFMGISLKNERWIISDREKFNNYNMGVL